MVKANYHTHTKYSDGKNTMEEMIRTAIDKGFTSLGFSDHSYTWFDESYCIKRENETAYRRELAECKNKYSGIIDLFSGIELDCDGDSPDHSYDYILGSVHYVKVKGEYFPVDLSADCQRKIVADCFGGNYIDMAKSYFEHSAEIISAKKPDIVGHFDLITKYSLFDTENPSYRDAALEALREIMKHCKRFELNTGAIARGLRTTPYPDDFLLREIYNLGGKKTIVIGGAYSVDKYYRLMRGIHWFADEQPSEEIKNKVEVLSADKKVAIALSLLLVIALFGIYGIGFNASAFIYSNF
jgi:histidinol-phosphatase (PHP family)